MLTRAAYLSRLRRAFLIRAHPDRLHSVKDDLLRVQQAAAVQAIIQRLQESDVAEWQQSSSSAGTSSTQASREQHGGPMSRSVQCLVLPLNSGNNATIHRAKIRLGPNVNVVLADLSDALRQSGAAEIPMPLDDSSFASSPAKRPPSANHHHQYQSGGHDEPHAAPRAPPRLQRRKLNEFLSTVQMSTIAERKQSRLEAHAVAASVRNSYAFLAVDATRIGWSSQSVVVLLRRLLSVQAEFASTVRPSYYPWKLVFSSSVCEEGAIDLHGAMLLLNPAGTNVQWLRGLELVNGSTNQAMLQIREEIDIFVKRLQSTWSVRLRKGFTCTSRAYYGALKRLCDEVTLLYPDSNCAAVDLSSTNLPSVEDVDVVIEDYTVCSRPQVTKSGSIMLGSRVTADECEGAVETLSLEANLRRQLFKEEKALSQQAARQAQQCLGLERVFFDNRTLSHHDFRRSLGRLVDKSDEYDMVGHLLEIVATDHFCHIADDGALVIPHNWC